MRSPRRNGMTRVEVAVGVACAVVILSLATGLFAQGENANVKGHKKTHMDAAQAGQIHRAMIIFANDNSGRFVIPGLINRLAIKEDAGAALAGRHVPGMGPEDESANTTANLYSSLIAQMFFTPELVVSPIERNPSVTVDDDYDFDAYNPAKDTYWDSTFAAELRKGSNVSYAHQPITKARRDLWRNTMDHHLAQIGNRGPKDGGLDPDSYTCGPHGNWAGNIVFGDNHTEFFGTTTPEKLKGDNLFAADAERELDALIAFTKSVKDGEAALQFD
jgi:hypothetical protein